MRTEKEIKDKIANKEEYLQNHYSSSITNEIMITKQQTLDTNNERNALAMALYNLCVRNNINPQDFIKTMKDTRKNIRKRYDN